MASMFLRYDLDEMPTAERRTADALERLPDDHRVYWSVPWMGRRAGRRITGEADFVVVSPARGVLVIEAKSGDVRVDDGRWYSRRSGERWRRLAADPYEQAHEGRHALPRRLNVAGVRWCYGVAFQDVSAVEALSSDLAEITLCAGDIDGDIHAALMRVFDAWDRTAPIAEAHLAALHQALRPSVTLTLSLPHAVSRIRTGLDDESEARVRSTADQLAALRLLHGVDRVAVFGGPGTGKTLLAVERARALAAEGRRVLVTCTSPAMASLMASALAPAHGAVALTARDVLREAARYVGCFDDLVIDEAQNLSGAMLARLLTLVPDDAGVFAFADRAQRRFDESWELPFAHHPFVLTENLRNTQAIADVAARLGSDSATASARVVGPEPEVIVCRDAAEMIAHAVERVVELVRGEGLDPGQIAVVTDREEVAGHVAGQGIACTTNAHEVGAALPEALAVGTWAALQGLERDVVIVLEPTTPVPPAALDRPSGSSSVPMLDLVDFDSVQRRHRVPLVIAFTRARTQLIVLGGRRLARLLNLPVSERPWAARLDGRGHEARLVGLQWDGPAVRGSRRNHLT